MPEYLFPGVYVEEVDTGNKPIECVATSTVGFLGVAERGPRTPMLVTSFTEYTRMFGSYSRPSYLTYSVEGFFQNGGKRCFVTRVAAHNAVAANVAVGNLTVTALGPGTWANNRVYVKITDCGLNNPTDPNTTRQFKLTVIYWDPSVNLPMPPVDPTDLTRLTDPHRREPTIMERYDNLSPDALSTCFCERMVNNASVLVTITLSGAKRPANTNALQSLANGNAGGARAKNWRICRDFSSFLSYLSLLRITFHIIFHCSRSQVSSSSHSRPTPSVTGGICSARCSTGSTSASSTQSRSGISQLSLS